MSAMRRAGSFLLSSRTLMLGAVAAAALAGAAFLNSGSPHQVVAYFTDADGLVAGNEIRVAGVQSGTVDTVEVHVDAETGAQYAVARLNIADDYWPLHRGTHFAVRPKGVLSNMFVSMTPGSKSNPVIDQSHVFSTAETDSPINLDAFSNLFDQDVRESLRTQIQQGVVAFGGTGADNTNGLLEHANPLTRDLSPVTAVLAERSPELDRLNVEFDRITAELSSEDSNLRGLIENGNTFLHAIATHATALQGTLVHAAGTLTSIDNGLKGEEANLATIFRKGPGSLDAAKYLSDQSIPVFNYINPHIAHLDELLSYFLSATGYQSYTSPTSNLTNPLNLTHDSFVLNSRVDATVFIPSSNFNGRMAISCGGQQWQTGPNNAGNCANVKPVPAPDGGGHGHSGSTQSDGTATQSSSTAGADPILQLFGGLFQ
jgi:phospholipid/cholesterol/gamma-HCH transport system substrate-binding protein